METKRVNIPGFTLKQQKEYLKHQNAMESEIKVVLKKYKLFDLWQILCSIVAKKNEEFTYKKRFMEVDHKGNYVASKKFPEILPGYSEDNKNVAKLLKAISNKQSFDEFILRDRVKGTQIQLRKKDVIHVVLSFMDIEALQKAWDYPVKKGIAKRGRKPSPEVRIFNQMVHLLYQALSERDLTDYKKFQIIHDVAEKTDFPYRSVEDIREKISKIQKG